MTLADDVLGALPEFQAAAESLMIDTCVVERSLGLVTDPATGAVSEGWETIHSGKCKVTGRVAQAASPDSGGHVFTVENLMVHLPVSTASQTGDRVTVTDTALDPLLIDLKLRLTELARGSIRTAYRWNAELVTE